MSLKHARQLKSLLQSFYNHFKLNQVVMLLKPRVVNLEIQTFELLQQSKKALINPISAIFA